jgi:hypothetical protein
MKYKMWEFGKEDLERLASRIMNQTLSALVAQKFMYQEDAKEFMECNTPIAITPDSIDDESRDKIFAKENLNAKCLFKVVRIK